MRFLISFAVALAIATASVTGECSDRLSCNRELLAQLTAAGAYTEAAPSIVQGEYYSGGELGMVAKSFIAEGDIAISVPVEAIVMPPTCEDPFDDKHDDAIMYLTRCLLKTENPLFKQYLAALPEETTNLYAYTEEEFAEFQDGGLKDILELKREAVRSACSLKRARVCSEQILADETLVCVLCVVWDCCGRIADEGGVWQHDGS